MISQRCFSLWMCGVDRTEGWAGRGPGGMTHLLASVCGTRKSPRENWSRSTFLLQLLFTDRQFTKVNSRAGVQGTPSPNSPANSSSSPSFIMTKMGTILTSPLDRVLSYLFWKFPLGESQDPAPHAQVLGTS